MMKMLPQRTKSKKARIVKNVARVARRWIQTKFLYKVRKNFLPKLTNLPN